MRTKGLDARNWALKAVDILGGKAGGKEEGAQGMGNNIEGLEKALCAAKEYFSTF